MKKINKFLMLGLTDLIFSRSAGKILTFLFNLSLVRHLSPDLWTHALHLQLPQEIVQVLVVETFRRLLLRTGAWDRPSLYAYLAGLAGSVAFLFGYLGSMGGEEEVEVVSLSGLILVSHFAAEYFYAVIQVRRLIRGQALSETVALLAKCLYLYQKRESRMTVVEILWSSIWYEIVLCLGFGVVVILWDGGRGKFLTPQKQEEGVLTLSLWISLQNAASQLLDSWAPFLFLSGGAYLELGLFSIAKRVASIPVKNILRPLEERVSVEFSDPEKKSRVKLRLLNTLCKLLLLAGLAALSLGPNFSFLFLHLLYGAAYSTPITVSLLSYLWIQIPLLGLCGLAESYINSSGRAQEVESKNREMSTVLLFQFLFLSAYLYCVGPLSLELLILSQTIALLAKLTLHTQRLRPHLTSFETPLVTLSLFPLSGALLYTTTLSSCSTPSLLLVSSCSLHAVVATSLSLHSLYLLSRLEPSLCQSLRHLL